MRTCTTTAIVLAVLALTLTACSSDDSDSKAETTPSASPTPAQDKEQQYLEAAHNIIFNGTPSDAELAAYLPRWCQELDTGHSVEWMFDVTGGGGLYPIGEQWGTAKADAHELLVAGVKAYCPENLDGVLEELRASGEY
ncbi:hypothetical protein AB0A94_38075 [Streptomyces sp. NPDC044984]|uniref:hypothetical protein n=1 Tax=Streptomyces sp. NPDC044984 TaxID=3154335 RepID=UPI0033E23B9E